VWCGPLVAALLALVACRGEQELHDDCPTAGTACPACATDADCIIVSNTCNEGAACTHRHRDPQLSVTQIGCSVEYDRPPAERCGCVDRMCRVR
jgi:hypothetical protein